HTRFSRDWSSDVCSSDLADRGFPHVQNSPVHVFGAQAAEGRQCSAGARGGAAGGAVPHSSEQMHRPDDRTGVFEQHSPGAPQIPGDRKSTRLNSSHVKISYAVFCLKKKKSNKYI